MKFQLTDFWDLCRALLVVLISVNLGAMAKISLNYYRMAGNQKISLAERLLPAHVWRVAVGTMVLMIGSLFAVGFDFDGGADHRIFIYLFGNAMLLFGFLKLIKFQYGQYSGD